MLTLLQSQKKFWDVSAEGYVLFLDENFEQSPRLKEVAEQFYPHINDILKKHLFGGKKNDLYVLSAPHNDGLIQLIFVGIGKPEKTWHRDLEMYRRSLARALQTLKKYSIPTASVEIPDHTRYKISEQELIRQTAIIAHMANYTFDSYKSDKKAEWSGNITLVTKSDVTDSLNEGIIIGKAINRTRSWADLPGNIATPKYMSNEAQKIAKEHNLAITVFGREKALELGMGGFCAVDSGSHQDGQFVALEYKNGGNKPTIALVGKGITFDTGGVSLKPANSMTGMKFDMSGAAAVISTMAAIAELKLPLNVVGVTPFVENMPGGNAARQDDIITHMNGVTSEIKNTDAEGRLILADALVYAEKNYNPEIIIDIATLTGACVYALGHFYTGLMTQDDELAAELIQRGQLIGERLASLPLDDDYKEAIKSDVADIGNTGSSSYSAGTITAAFYLSNFVKKARWAHLDVAGSAHDVPGINYTQKGSSGAGVRLFIEFLKQRA